MFCSIYNVRTELDKALFGYEVKEEVEPKDKKAMDVLNKELEELEESYSFYIEEANAISNKIMFLKRIISEINA